MSRFKLYTKTPKTASQYLSKFLETGNFVVPIALLVLSISNALISVNEILAKIFGSISLFIIVVYLNIYVYVKICSKYQFLKDRFHDSRR